MSYAYGICSDTSIDRRRAIMSGRPWTNTQTMIYVERLCVWNFDFEPFFAGHRYAAHVPAFTHIPSRERERRFLAANPVCEVHDAPPVALRERFDSRLRLHLQVFERFLRDRNQLYTMRVDPEGLHQLWRAS